MYFFLHTFVILERKIQLIETTGEGKSAVATPDGKKPKEEEVILESG